MARDVFISYQQADRVAAERVCAALEDSKISCWIAPRDITPGQEWATGIVEGLKRCHSFVVILSAHSADARQVAREVELADNCGLRMIAFRLEDIRPSQSLLYFLGNVQWLDAFPDRFEEALGRLEEVVQRTDGYPAAATANRRAYSGQAASKRGSRLRSKALVWKIAAGALLAGSLGAGSYMKVQEVRAQRAFRDGQKQFESHHLAEALAAYNLAISLDPDLYLAYCQRAIVRHQMKQEKLALQDINRALDLNRSWTIGFRIRGDIENSLRQYELAIRDYSTAIDINTPDPRGISNVGLAYRGRARARRALGQTDLSEQDAAAAKALCGGGDPISADLAFACG